MNRIAISLLMFLFSLSSVFAQLKTGDPELDATLKDLNVNAKVDLSIFKKDLSATFSIGETKVDQLLQTYNMQPADLFMTLQVAQQCGKTPEQVADNYKTNKDKGWGVIAKEMGIKPGSPEFHALKNSAKGKNDKMKEKNKGKGKGKGNGGKKK